MLTSIALKEEKAEKRQRGYAPVLPAGQKFKLAPLSLTQSHSPLVQPIVTASPPAKVLHQNILFKVCRFKHNNNDISLVLVQCAAVRLAGSTYGFVDAGDVSPGE